MIRYKVIKATRRLRILFGGFTEMEEKHKLFQFQRPLTPEQIAGRLMAGGYYYNHISTTFRRQIYTVRKILDLRYQRHLRFYSNLWVTGHVELIPEFYPLEHLDGEELRALTKEEIEELRSYLCSDTPNKLAQLD